MRKYKHSNNKKPLKHKKIKGLSHSPRYKIVNAH